MTKLKTLTLSAILAAGLLFAQSPAFGQSGPFAAQIQAALRSFLRTAHTWTAVQTFSGGISGGAVTATGLTVAAGTLTANTPFSFSQTWNNAGVTFSGVLIDITNTASNAASRLFDIQDGAGGHLFQVAANGNIIVNGTSQMGGTATQTGSGRFTVQSSGGFSWSGGAIIQSTANPNIQLVNSSGNSGFIIDGQVDGTLAVQTRAGADTATLKANTLNAGSVLVANGVTITNAVTGVAGSYKVARGATAFDGTNPTTVATGLTTVVSCTATLQLTAALTTNTAFVTHAAASGANVDFYEWTVAGTASTGTETFEWVCVGT